MYTCFHDKHGVCSPLFTSSALNKDLQGLRWGHPGEALQSLSHDVLLPESTSGCSGRQHTVKRTNAEVCVRHYRNVEAEYAAHLVKAQGQGLRLSGVLLVRILLRIWT